MSERAFPDTHDHTRDSIAASLGYPDHLFTAASIELPPSKTAAYEKFDVYAHVNIL